MKITSEIFQVGGNGISAPNDAAVYLIAAGGSAALIDAGCGDSAGIIYKNIQECGVNPRDVEFLLLTHCHFDHTGGARALQGRCDCKIVAHKEDAKFLESGASDVTAATWYGSILEPLMVDWKLDKPRTDILLGDKIIQAIHTPGHSPGSVVYLAEYEGLRVLFGQDVHGPLHASFLSNREDYRSSLQLLISLEADILCEGHFGVYQGKEDVRRFIASYL